MGAGESIKGWLKQKFGGATGDEHLAAEGEAQQSKGEEQLHETKERAEAQAHEKKADALGKEQDAVEEN